MLNNVFTSSISYADTAFNSSPLSCAQTGLGVALMGAGALPLYKELSQPHPQKKRIAAAALTALSGMALFIHGAVQIKRCLKDAGPIDLAKVKSFARRRASSKMPQKCIQEIVCKEVNQSGPKWRSLECDIRVHPACYKSESIEEISRFSVGERKEAYLKLRKRVGRYFHTLNLTFTSPGRAQWQQRLQAQHRMMGCKVGSYECGDLIFPATDNCDGWDNEHFNKLPAKYRHCYADWGALPKQTKMKAVYVNERFADIFRGKEPLNKALQSPDGIPECRSLLPDEMASKCLTDTPQELACFRGPKASSHLDDLRFNGDYWKRLTYDPNLSACYHLQKEVAQTNASASRTVSWNGQQYRFTLRPGKECTQETV